MRRFELSQIVNERAAAVAEDYALPIYLDPSNFAVRNPSLDPPDASKPAKNGGGIIQARASALANLVWLPESLDATTSTWLQAVSWLNHSRLQPLYIQNASRGVASALLALSSVERLVFSRAALLNADDGQSPLASAEALAMEAVVETYRVISDTFRRLPAAQSLMHSELLSHELLIVWTVFCLSHQSTSRQHPLMSEFAVALDAEKLRHLVLSSKLARDAVVHVLSYLRANRNSTSALPVFSLLGDDATFHFARRFVAEAPGGDDMRSKWSQERAAAEQRQRARLDVVDRKLSRLTVLDRELIELQGKLLTWRQTMNRYESPRSRTPYRAATTLENDIRYQQAESEIDAYESKIAAKNSEIQIEQVPPPPIFQPLPASERTAQPIIFFLFMPTEFQVLSRLSFTAQQMLLPRDPTIKLPHGNKEVNVKECIAIEAGPETVWRDYYQAGSTARTYTSWSNKLILGSYYKKPREVGPDNVRSYRRPTVIPGPSDGVWHPDSLEPVLFWDGGGFKLDTRDGFFNPFAASVPESVTAIRLTERLPKPFHALQWAMYQLSDGIDDPTRGNVAEAWQDEKPSWLSKQAYLSFGKIRAYPNQQLREICVALHDRRLPMDHPAVRLLLQQAMFHVGDLSKEEPPRPQWRTDMADHDGWSVLRQELEGYADECKFKSREHGSAFLCGLMAAHASQWDVASRDVARQFAAITSSWAEQLADQLHAAATSHPKRVASLRARRCLFYMYGILCHGAGDLTLEDTVELCKFVLLADYNRLFEEATELDCEVRALTTITSDILARRLPDMIVHIESDESILTAAVRLVLHETPEALTWERVQVDGSNTACFEALALSGGAPMLMLYADCIRC